MYIYNKLVNFWAMNKTLLGILVTHLVDKFKIKYIYNKSLQKSLKMFILAD